MNEQARAEPAGTAPGLRGRPGPRGPARVPLLAPASLVGERARLHAEITGGPRAADPVVPLTDAQGRLLGPFGVMLLSPHIGGAVQAVGAALRFDGSVAPRTRELAILAVAVHRGCEFEWLAHEDAARAAGLTDLQLQALLDAVAVPGLSTGDELALRVVRALLRDGELDDHSYHAAVAELGAPTLAALVWLVGYYQMLATALATFRPPLSAPDPS